MFRQATIIVLIAAYSLLGLRSMVPMLSYELNYRYFSEEACVNKDLPICCQGACQLKKMAKQTEDSESDTGQQLPTETERTLPLVHLEAATTLNDWLPADALGLPSAHTAQHPIERAPGVETPPPRVV